MGYILSNKRSYNFVDGIFSWLTICVIFLISLQGVAHVQGVDPGWESYLNRPDILSMQPGVVSSSNTSVDKLRVAHFSFIAFLLEAYPSDTKIYFLARDSEYLYDVARLVTNGTDDIKRLHLLNISRANMKDANLVHYLRQNGISDAGLRKGEKVLFVDTGFSGTISRTISQLFPEDVRSKLKTHLLVSSNPMHPSAKSFLNHLNPMILDKQSSQMLGTILNYEHMPRFTDRSSRFQLIHGIYHPVSLKEGSEDGLVNKDQSRAFMQSLVNDWSTPRIRARFNFERRQAKWLQYVLSKGSEADLNQVKQRLASESKYLKRVIEAQLRDLHEAKINTQTKVTVALEELGLAPVNVDDSLRTYSKKNQLILDYPEWAPILENPSSKIPELFAKSDWQMIGNLIDANVDIEINKLLGKQLFASVATGIKRDLQILLLEKVDPLTMNELSYGIAFLLEKSNDAAYLFRIVVEKASSSALEVIVSFAFSHPDRIHPNYKVLVEAAKIKDVPARKAFLNSHYFPQSAAAVNQSLKYEAPLLCSKVLE